MAYLLGKVPVSEFEQLVFQNGEKDTTANLTGHLYVHIGPVVKEKTGGLFLCIVKEPGQMGSAIMVPYAGEPFWKDREEMLKSTQIDRHHLVKYQNHWMKVSIKPISEFLKSGTTSDIEICIKFYLGIQIVLQQSGRDDRLSVSVSCKKNIHGFEPKHHVKEIDLDPNLENAKLWERKGDKSLHNKKHEEAVKAYVKALEITPGNPKLWGRKGIALYRLERYDEAVKAYDRAIQINTENALSWGRTTRIGNLPKRKHEDEDRKEAYARQREIEKRNAELWERKGAAFYQLGRYEEEKWAYNLAREISDEPFYGGSSCCEWFVKKAKSLHATEEAIKAWDEALEFEPGNAYLWKEKGDVLKQLGRLDDAEKCFSRAGDPRPKRNGDQEIRAPELNLESARFWEKKGQALLRLGRYDEAIEVYDGAPYKSAELLERKGEALYQLRRNEKAIEAYNEARDLKCAKLWGDEGDALFGLLRYDEAIKAYEKALDALELNPKKSQLCARLWKRKGDAFYQKGIKEKTNEAYDRALEIELENLQQRVDDNTFLIYANANNEMEWGGADVIISNILTPSHKRWLGNQPGIVISFQNTQAGRRLVITNHSKELSWLFNKLRDIFQDRIDFISKYDFFGLLAQAAIDCLEENKGEKREVDCKILLTKVIGAAKKFGENAPARHQIVIQYDQSLIKQQFLLTSEDSPLSADVKMKFSKEIESGEIQVVNLEKGIGKTIDDALFTGGEGLPCLVAELTPSAMKKSNLNSPYVILND